MLLQLDDSKLWFTSCIALVSVWLLVLFLRKPSAPPNDSKNLYPSSTTFRLQGIPKLVFGYPSSKGDVIRLIRKAWNIGDDVTTTIHSLAMDPSDDTKKIATLSFEAPPQFISRSARKWTATLPGEAEDSIDLALDVEFFGVTPFHREPDAECTYDIVALSGLNGHAFGSFKQRGESTFMWLRDALPQHLARAGVHARVFIYGYDSRLIKSDSFQEISDLGLEFKNKMVQLTQNSTSSGMRRLVLIGHSLGGILVKQTITSLDRATSSVHENRTLQRLLGAMFFGTPSQGMDIDTLLPMVDGQPNELFVRTLGSSSGTLRNQMDEFRRSFERMSFLAVWYYETKESPTARQIKNGEWKMDGPKRRLVDISSATNGMPHDYERHTVRPINRSHSEMVKFQGPTDEVYRQVLADLKNITSSKSVIAYALTTEQDEFLKSLDFAGQDRRRDSISKATNKTCDWLFRSREFRTWIEPNCAARGKGLLWVKGNPGVGKSTVMKEALRRTQDGVFQTSTNVVSFFFNARGGELEKTTRGLYRSLLHQILKHDLSALDYLLPSFLEKRKGKNPDRMEWEEEVLKDNLLRVCQHGISIPVLFFIDALDECTDPEISRLVEFFEDLVSRGKNTNAGLRACISSRHCPRPPTFGYPEIVVEHQNKGDIYEYIKAELKHYKALFELRYRILEKSAGVFLWVRLVIRELKREEDRYSGRPIAALEKKLADIPSELGALFSGLLEKIDPIDRPRSVLLFQLILFSERRLHVEEIAAAISFYSGTCFDTIAEWAESSECINGLENQIAMIINLSGGLLEFVDSGEDKPYLLRDVQLTCQFIHESVQEYFLKYGGFKSLFMLPDVAFIAGWCHSGIAICSSNYLRAVSSKASERPFVTVIGNIFDTMTEEFDEHKYWKSAVLNSAAFLLYATIYIYKHVEVAEKEGISQEAALSVLTRMDAHANSVFGKISETLYFNPEHTHLFRCCQEGMMRFNTISRLIEMETDPRPTINSKNGKGDELALAVACEHEDSVPLIELLLQNGADVEARNTFGENALIVAVKWGNINAVQILLSYGADIESRDHKGQTAMHYAVLGPSEIIKLLLRNGARPDVEDHDGQTPLIRAGWFGAFHSFPPLINAGADVNHRTSIPGNAGTVLHMALEEFSRLVYRPDIQGVYEAIECSVENGLDLDVRDREGSTVWHHWISLQDAIWPEMHDMVLWEKGVELLWPRMRGESPDISESDIFSDDRSS